MALENRQNYFGLVFRFEGVAVFCVRNIEVVLEFLVRQVKGIKLKRGITSLCYVQAQMLNMPISKFVWHC